ncbi:7-carboxy-7-deazaguanine synthase (Cx14CxxC type) [Lewinella marina]|uniref:7-carboxy-7-deazaguanine synthase n=1 Tax=Neolewinella marina TaxID=438751 RepID=A0A2G0CHH2_9BACT|nr:7-carboxy-7-deazaguanine synthase [Neolewinella marina]NJB86152.1 7-carboxy-7-deazaguanine synthase (Cx14CxxC type) [Neolewinella marina]PHK99370.1 7-carboxy-7-deazaguanine synthase [Neolewinella marina]
MSRTYKIKECFYTLQGEGAQAGRAAVFLRFTGCNLWSGREEDRHAAVCKFCDTDFIGTDGTNGGRYTLVQCVELVASLWPGGGRPYVVCTGGEPLLQLDVPLIEAFQAAGFEVAVETNGTLPVPEQIDWVCVSPKADATLAVSVGDELKLVYPQTEPSAHPSRFAELAFSHFFLQPKDEAGQNHLSATVAYCLSHPQWRVSLQTHKIMGIE